MLAATAGGKLSIAGPCVDECTMNAFVEFMTMASTGSANFRVMTTTPVGLAAKSPTPIQAMIFSYTWRLSDGGGTAKCAGSLLCSW